MTATQLPKFLCQDDYCKLRNISPNDWSETLTKAGLVDLDLKPTQRSTESGIATERTQRTELANWKVWVWKCAYLDVVFGFREAKSPSII